MTYRYYSIGHRQPGGPLVILGWSRTQEAATARKGTRYWAHAGTRQQAARLIKAAHGVTVDLETVRLAS